MRPSSSSRSTPQSCIDKVIYEDAVPKAEFAQRQGLDSQEWAQDSPPPRPRSASKPKTTPMIEAQSMHEDDAGAHRPATTNADDPDDIHSAPTKVWAEDESCSCLRYGPAARTLVRLGCGWERRPQTPIASCILVRFARDVPSHFMAGGIESVQAPA